MSLHLLNRACALASQLARPACVTATSSRTLFYTRDRKEGYEREDPTDNLPLKDQVKLGMQSLKEEFHMLKSEVVDAVKSDPKIYYPGDSEVFWRFNEQHTIDKWIVTTDKDNGEGFSTAEFTLGPGKTGIFSGVLDPSPPKGSMVKRTGYCNVRSERKYKSFARDDYYDWSVFTHLLFRVRGDGRSYMINLGMDGPFDISWNVIYHFILYTRGGPYWQVAKIPFSKFFLSYKGRVQDKQCPIARTRITNLGLTVGDGIPGPFRLEIDYIGGHIDDTHTEEFAYEMYETPVAYVPGY
ncbi:complex I intermediate-associated protein 30, mitochondrial-like [Ornithodoros turicata]|uniref:complex I intermediate-associated protein 30, mitochondrial-like n=1 Tax=Ornithodoros turicata TaxID=34597 RepID=UPI0031390C8C